MCGRFTISIDENEMQEILRENYDIEDKPEFKLPRYNVAPGQEIISIINDGKKFRVGTLKWGFVPSWANDEKIGYKMINAKAETLIDKPSFKHSFINKRCIILANSFYEWKLENEDKIPMRIKLKNNTIFSMAGLWSTFIRSDGSKLFTCTIITTTPNDLVANFHNRMPVILTNESEKIWLNPTITDNTILNTVLKPYDHNLMDAYRVSSVVNNTRNDNLECIKPII